jgi:hypothetical protein
MGVRKLEEVPVPLTVIAGSLEVQPDGLRFKCDRGGELIQCGIADIALRDLIGFHRIKKTGDDPFRVLLPEIERLVNVKCDAGQFEENGGLLIQSVDLLRYGFRGRARSTA